jgi:hypothetical protein
LTPEPTPSPFRDPTPTPAADPHAPVDPLLEAMTREAAANLEACWNAGRWDAVAANLTPRFLRTSLGIDAAGPDDQAAALAALALGPLRIEEVEPVVLWSDGRGAVDMLYRRGRGKPVQAVAARWFLVAHQGKVRFDEEAVLPPPILGDRVTVGFSIADDEQPLRWDGAFDGRASTSAVIALHGANRGWLAHTVQVVNDAGGVVGMLTLPSWQQGDLVLLDLPPGTYRLRDPDVPGSEETLVIDDPA